MELKELIDAIYTNKKLLVIFAFIGLFTGSALFYLPAKFISTGSLYITRSVENTDKYFTYEGYYSQQTAVAYTNTALALLESIDVKTQALEKAGLEPNSYNLRKYSKLVDVKKNGPQLITLTVKDNSFEKSQNLWNSIADSFIKYSEEANVNTDPNLKVLKISPNPVVKPQYKSFYFYTFCGLAGGLTFGLILAGINSYFGKTYFGKKHETDY